VREASAGLRKAEAGLALARSEWLPEFMIQYRRRDMRDPAMNDSHDVMLGLTLPLWFGQQRAAVRQAAAERRMAQAELGAVRAGTRADVRELAVRLQTARRLVELYASGVLPQAEQALRVAQAAYQSDQATFLELLDSQRSLLEFKIDYYSHLAAYQASLGRLERAVGVRLEVP
jgi:outer membrane protein TolC